jgi:hypothetical protein
MITKGVEEERHGAAADIGFKPNDTGNDQPLPPNAKELT